MKPHQHQLAYKKNKKALQWLIKPYLIHVLQKPLLLKYPKNYNKNI